MDLTNQLKHLTTEQLKELQKQVIHHIDVNKCFKCDICKKELWNDEAPDDWTVVQGFTMCDKCNKKWIKKGI